MADRFIVEVHGPISPFEVCLYEAFETLRRVCKPKLRQTVSDAALASVALARALQRLAQDHAPEAEHAAACIVGALFSRIVENVEVVSPGRPGGYVGRVVTQP